MILLLLLAAAPVALAPKARIGEKRVFDESTTSEIELELGKQKIAIRLSDARSGSVVVVDAKGGRPAALVLSYATHRVGQRLTGLGGGDVENVGAGAFEGVELRATDAGGRYRLERVKGPESDTLAAHLKQRPAFLLGEEALPATALALGDSVVVRDPRVLAGQFGGLAGIKVVEPYVLTLASRNGQVAVLRGQAKIEGTLQIPSDKAPTLPLRIDVSSTTEFDLAKGRVRKHAVAGTSKGAREGLRFSAKFEKSVVYR